MKTKLFFLLIALMLPGFTAWTKDSYWPKEVRTSNGIITIYQPQTEHFQGNNLTARAALSVKQKKDNEPVFGAFWFDARVFTDREDRMVILKSISIKQIKFPDEIGISKREEITAILETEIPKLSLEFPLDELLTTIEDTRNDRNDDEYNNEPPEIIIKNKPAVLITIDGEPKTENIEGSDLQQVINTPFFILYSPKSREYWLYGDGMWFVTKDVIRGRWMYVSDPPVKMQQMVEETDDEENYGKPSVIPEIVVRTTPAELIVIDGEPQMAPIERTELLYIKNTESDVIFDIHSQSYFILLSGRWYVSSSLNGPWSYRSADMLPKDFARIPEGSEKDRVLASVAGTDAAREAMLDAMIPQTATVKRNEARIDVSYDGNPRFVDIPGTRVAYAENSPNSVLLINNYYYACENGVWFESARPMGPWVVCVRVPAEVQHIPPSAPVYHVKYVYVYDYTPDVVYVGYSPAYTGCYVYRHTVVYGTGYHYHAWYGNRYFPRPWTYGYHMHYNPYAGWSIGFTMTIWRPYRWFTYYYTHPHYHYHYYGGYWGPHAYRPPYHYHYRDVHYYGPKPSPRPTPVVNHRAAPTQNIYYAHRQGVEPTRRTATTSYRQAGAPSPSRTTSTTTRRTGESTSPARTPAQTSTRQSTSARPVVKNTTESQPASRPSSAQPSTRPSTSSRPASAQTTTPSRRTSTTTANKAPSTNNIYTDKEGNVYRKTGQEWQKRENNTWTPATQQQPTTRTTNQQSARPSVTTAPSPDLERQSQSRERGVQRTTNAQTIKSTSSGRTSSQTRSRSSEESSSKDKPQSRPSTSNAGRR